MSYGEDLKKMRINLGLTQAELAELSGVAATQISKYEKGDHEPSAITRKKLEEALGVSVVSSRKNYICPKCGNPDHESNAKFCKLCGAKIKTQTDMLVEDLKSIIIDIIPHAPESMRDKARDSIRAACRWIEARGGRMTCPIVS